MEHKESKQYLDNLITQQTERTRETSERMPKQLPESWVIRLFSKFQVIYGSKWLAVIDGDEVYALALQEWGERLHGLTGKQIQHGLDNLKGEWTPTPMTFRELCTDDDGLHNTAAYRPFDRSTAIELKADKEIARAGMAKIRELMK